jgi:transcription initiation factor TFIIA small subunit
MALTDALDEMVTARELTPTFGAHLHTYRFCDNVWTFILENVKFKTANYSGIVEEIHADKVKIVACDSKILEGK